MPIPPIDRFRAAEGSQPPRKASASDASRKPDRPSSDEIDISEEGRDQLRVHEAVVAVKRAAADVPDVREERVQQARQRVQEGYYERPEVRGSIVEALLSAFRKPAH
ncbi:MAG: flagellar biosynthesis anti-sigma factor FlgM [Candidatus Eisenbacteria bacterium]|nr:flagellar biosynthesis anti-sigma factor FlgM [Candidatus Eisenbacteria bacterium]